MLQTLAAAPDHDHVSSLHFPAAHAPEGLAFLMVLTFARDLASAGRKCQNRNTSFADP
jgi:hypothetical protein